MGTINEELRSTANRGDTKQAQPPRRKKIHRTKARTELKSAVADINREYAVVHTGFDVVIAHAYHDQDLDRDVVSFLPKVKMQDWFANRMVPLPDTDGGVVYKRIFSVWFHSPERREYDGITMSPRAPGVPPPQPDDKFNLWRGWGVVPDARAESGCRLFLNHLREVICAGDVEKFDWLIAWLAQAVQQPAQKPGTAVMTKSIKHGAGKGIAFTYIGRMYGAHYRYLNDAEQITGKHNELLQNALFVFGDEITYARAYKAADKLKSLITEPHTVIEPKFVNSFQVANHMRLVVATNAERPMPIASSDRRWLVLDAAEHRIGDGPYFTALADEMNNGGPACLLQYLANYPISADVNLRIAPRTGEKLEQQERSYTVVQEWWHDCLHQGEIVGANYVSGDWQTGSVTVGREPAYYAFTQYARSHGAREQLPSPKMLWAEIDQLMPPANGGRRLLARTSKRAQLDDWEIKLRAYEAPKRWVRFFLLPSVADCRSAFERWIGRPLDWDDSDTDGGAVPLGLQDAENGPHDAPF